MESEVSVPTFLLQRCICAKERGLRRRKCCPIGEKRADCPKIPKFQNFDLKFKFQWKYKCIVVFFFVFFYLFNLSTFFFAALRFFFFFVYCTFFSFFVSFFHNDSKWLDSLKILFLQFHLLLHHFWCKNERENGAKNKIFQNPTLKNFYEKKIQKKKKIGAINKKEEKS